MSSVGASEADRHVFTANMTGNIVLLGFGIARGGGLPVVSPLGQEREREGSGRER